MKRDKEWKFAHAKGAPRNKEQSMGVWLNEGIISQPEKIDRAVRDLARSGYGIIRTMLRNTNFNHRSPQVVETVARIVDVAHAEGVRVVLDCEPHPEPVAHDMGNLYPDAIGMRIVRKDVPVINGRFKLHLLSPMGSSARTVFRGIAAAFLDDGNTTTKIESLSFEYRVVSDPYRNGFTTADHSYTEGRPAFHDQNVYISGTIPHSGRGQLIVYANFFDPRVIDFWSVGARKYYDQVLECYQDIALDGVAWDEPAADADWSHYLWGDAFGTAFQQRNGYALADRWYCLDSRSMSLECVRVRLDYYRTLNEGVFEAQQHLFAKADELFGENLLRGTHHTWQGEGGINDYRTGAVDYFRLNDQMDAGYTDCWWWDQKSVCYAYTLGSSLGRLTLSGEAEINTWDAKPTNSRVEFQARLMTLLNLIWFNIWYGEATDTCLYPADYTWATTVREMNRHRDALLRIGMARPVVKVAMLHGWETVCGINRADIASAHKAFCLNTAELFVGRNLAFDWIDTRLLANSSIEDGQLVNGLGRYSILVLPYASFLSRPAWMKCLEFARGGGKVIFIGPPPGLDIEGNALVREFAGLLGMPEVSLENYLAEIDAVCTLPTHRPNKLDVCLELSAEASRLLISKENEAHGIQNKDGNVVWLTDLDPRLRLLQIIERWLIPEITCYSDSILWRLYRETGREVLICIARQDCQMRGIIRWRGYEVEFRSGLQALLEIEKEELSVVAESAEFEVTHFEIGKE